MIIRISKYNCSGNTEENAKFCLASCYRLLDIMLSCIGEIQRWVTWL